MPLGIVLGLFFGKQIGVFVLSYISVKLKFVDKPSGSSWPAFYAVSILTGIGFTMSLFVGNLAFANNLEYMDGVKIESQVPYFQLYLDIFYCYCFQKMIDSDIIKLASDTSNSGLRNKFLKNIFKKFNMWR